MNIEFALDGKVRDKPVADDYLSALDSVLKATDPRLGARIVSAGQSPKGSGGKRTGSTRHDVDHTGHSHTSDLVLTLDGKEIRPGDNKELYAKFLRNAAPKFPGIGHYDWGVHIGDGSLAMWGPDKTSKSIDPIFAKAISEGRSGTSMPAPMRKKVSDPAVLAKLNGKSAGPSGEFAGMVEKGNIDLGKRPTVKNADGSISTVRSVSFNIDGKEVLIPTVSPDGKILSNEDALRLYRQTGEHLGKFDTPEHATTYANSLHDAQANYYGSAKRKKVTDPSVLAKLNGGTEKPAVDPKTNQPAGVPEFKPVGVDNYNPQTGEVENTGAVDKLGAFSLSAVDAVPIVGPTLSKATKATAAGIVAPFTDDTFGEVYDDMGRTSDDVQRDNSGVALAGRITGAVAPMVGFGATALGGRMLGSAGNSLASRTLASGASNAMIAATDTAARGGNPMDMLKGGGISGLIGLAIPGAGAAVNSIGKAVKDAVGPRLNALFRPGYEAERRVGNAMVRDAKNTAAPLLNQADEASAAVNNQTLLNVDRGGENTRALARASTNTDPDARAIIEKTANDRFASQGDRARSFIDRITGGATDDLDVQSRLADASRRANKPAYDRAFAADAAQDMSSPELLDMLKSPAVRQAAAAAEKRGADRAVVEGFETVRNPFIFDEAGNVSLKEGVKPTLQFWNQVKINLDGEIGKAVRAGDKTLARDLTGLKTKLVGALDNAVPDYKSARQGAAAFFDAEDALDAGKKFVTQNRKNAEVAAALKKMSPAERTTFAVGFASELKDAIKQSGDSTNVIKKLFGSEQAREKIRMALGDKAFKEFEQFVKVENSIDMLRGAMGNSKTAQFLAEMGAVSVGTGAYTGDWRQGLTSGILWGIVRRGGAKVDERVTKRVAELLISDDPKALQKAVTLASNSPKAAAALEAIQGAISSTVKSIGQSATRPERKPLEVTVTQPNSVEN